MCEADSLPWSGSEEEKAYDEMGVQLRRDILGTAAEEQPEQRLAALLENPGTLHDERYKKMAWHRPDKESATVWWCDNAEDEERTQVPRLLSRRLACCRLHLSKQREATPIDVVNAWQARTEGNDEAVAVLRNNTALWSSISGPDPNMLFAPKSEALLAVCKACRQLEEDADVHGAIGEEVLRAARSITSLDWCRLRLEKFHITSERTFDGIAWMAHLRLETGGFRGESRWVLMAWLHHNPVREYSGSIVETIAAWYPCTIRKKRRTDSDADDAAGLNDDYLEHIRYLEHSDRIPQRRRRIRADPQQSGTSSTPAQQRDFMRAQDHDSRRSRRVDMLSAFVDQYGILGPSDDY